MASLSRSRRYEPAGSTNAVTSFVQLALTSMLIWALISILCFFTLVDFRVSSELSFPVWADVDYAWATVSDLVILVGTSVLLGLVLALPSAFVRAASRHRIEEIQRRVGRIRSMRVIVLRALPAIVFAGTHVLVLLFSLATAPQQVRSWSKGPTAFSEAIDLLYSLFFVPEDKAMSAEWRAIAKSDSPVVVSVAVPASVLVSRESLPRTRKVLGAARRFLVDAQSFPAHVAQVLDGQPAVERKWSVPLTSLSDALGASGVTTRAALSFSPEWNGTKASEGNSSTRDGATSEQNGVHALDGIRRRTAHSQVHLYLLFRWNLLSLFRSQWRWENLVADDAHALKRFARTLATSGAGGAHHLLQLSEREQMVPGIRHPLAAVRWPGSLDPSERAALARRLDNALSLALGALADRRNVLLSVIPYPDEVHTTPFAWGFVKGVESPPRASPGGGTAEPAEHWMLARDIHGFASRIMGKASSTQPTSGSGGSCYPLVMNFAQLTQPRYLVNLTFQRAVWRAVRMTSNGRIAFPESLDFFPSAFRLRGALCRGNNPATGDWLVHWPSAPREHSNTTGRERNGSAEATLAQQLMTFESAARRESAQRKSVANSLGKSRASKANESGTLRGDQADLWSAREWLLHSLPPLSAAKTDVALEAPLSARETFAAEWESTLQPLFQSLARLELN